MNSMTIKLKLYLTYGCMAFLALAMGISSIVILHRLTATVKELGVSSAGKMYDAGMINGDTAELPSLVRGAYVRSTMGQPEAAEKYIAEYAKMEQDIHTKTADMLAVGMKPAGAATLNDLTSQLSDSDSIFQQFVQKVRAGDLKGALDTYITTLLAPLKKIDDKGSDLLDQEKEEMAEINIEAEKEVTTSYWIMVILMSLGVAVGRSLDLRDSLSGRAASQQFHRSFRGRSASLERRRTGIFVQSEPCP